MSLPPADAQSTCLVTGASSGIGVQLARKLAERGYGVTLTARRGERLRELADELASRFGVRIEVIVCDLADAESRDALIRAIDERGLKVDVLINNAGFGTVGRFDELSAEVEIRMVRTNAEAVLALCAAYVPAMVHRGAGAVLNVASTAAFQPVPRQATYAATKAFVLNFSAALQTDLAGTGVTVATLCPGPVDSEFVDVAGVREQAERIPRFIWTSPAQAADAGLRALEKGRPIVVPGALNKAAAFAGQHTPRTLITGVARAFSGRARPG